jgi:hypothetical protein
LIEPAHVVSLPKGQAFALLEGGNLWKIRMPLPAPDPDELMPKDLRTLAENMRNSYVDGGGEWWTSSGTRSLDETLPSELLDDEAIPDALEATDS